MVPRKRIEWLLKRIVELEKKVPQLAEATKSKEVKKGLTEICTLLPEIGKTIRKVRPTKALPKLLPTMPKVSGLLKYLEDKETKFTLRFDNLTLKLDGEKSFTITLLSKGK